MSCEKNTDRLFLNYWEKIFGRIYNTNNNKKLFNNLVPDGYNIINNNLFIIENKKEYKDKINAKKQLIKYYNIVIEKDEYNFNKIYLIFGYGDNENNFNYEIFIINNEGNLIKINKTLENIKEEMEIKKNKFDEKEIHKFNQYLYNNCNNISNKQKTLFVASILLTLNIEPDFIKDYDIKKPGFIIVDKMIELIQKGYKDETLTNSFSFLKNNLKNKYLYDLINKISIDIKKYSKDILNKFYSEFCVWDKNNDAENGVVLTPHDIIELMIKELDIKKDDIVLDFCTGTGSFLLEASKYTKNLIGCEYNEERFTLSKCNFILNNLDYNNLYYNSCFNYKFPKVNKSIINPPFSCDVSDEENDENITNWKNYNKEQKFLLYQIQCLKENGLGACIIPRSNFNNSLENTNKFKKELLKHIEILKIINCNNKVFYPVAGPECSIIIYKRIKDLNEPKLSKNVKIIDYSNDGFDINKKLRIKIKEPEIKEQIRDLDYNDDWNYINYININNDINIKLLLQQQLLKTFNNQFTYNILNNININNTINIIDTLKNDLLKIDNLQFNNFKQIKIKDIFIKIKPLKTFQIKKTIEGNIPLISSSSLNNGVSKYINDFSYNGECISIARNGSVGVSFYHNGKIGITSDVILLKSKQNINYNLYVSILNYILPKKYSYSNKLTETKLMNEIINIPIF